MFYLVPKTLVGLVGRQAYLVKPPLLELDHQNRVIITNFKVRPAGTYVRKRNCVSGFLLTVTKSS